MRLALMVKMPPGPGMTQARPRAGAADEAMGWIKRSEGTTRRAVALRTVQIDVIETTDGANGAALNGHEKTPILADEGLSTARELSRGSLPHLPGVVACRT